MNVIKNSAKAIALVSGISILLIGCSRYEIEPNYNKKDKSLVINNFEFKNVELDENKKGGTKEHIGFFVKEKSSYLINDEKCKYLQFDKMSSNSRNGFLTMNTEDILEKEIVEKRNGNCDVTRINNLKFLECSTSKDNYYVMTTSEGNPHANGYQSVESIYTDKYCYEKVLNFSKKQAEKDNVDIENYTMK